MPESSTTVFVDTNVLLYSFDPTRPEHGACAHLLERARTGGASVALTSQILCEFYSYATNPGSSGVAYVSVSRRTRFSHSAAFFE